MNYSHLFNNSQTSSEKSSTVLTLSIFNHVFVHSCWCLLICTTGSEKFKRRNKNDIAWKHGVFVVGGTKKIKCNYYGKVGIGGDYRLKHRFGHTQCNVGACEFVPDDVKVQMWEFCKALQVK
jgi:hypothetical protein